MLNFTPHGTKVTFEVVLYTFTTWKYIKSYCYYCNKKYDKLDGLRFKMNNIWSKIWRFLGFSHWLSKKPKNLDGFPKIF